MGVGEELVQLGGEGRHFRERLVRGFAGGGARWGLRGVQEGFGGGGEEVGCARGAGGGFEKRVATGGRGGGCGTDGVVGGVFEEVGEAVVNGGGGGGEGWKVFFVVGLGRGGSGGCG